VVEIVSRGHGYTVLHSMATDSVSRRGYEGVVVAFNSPVPAREVSLVHRRGYLKRGIERALRETIEDSLPPGIQRKKSRDLNVLSLMGQFK
jgi:DNA-binding transcriptional LysR family regulator